MQQMLKLVILASCIPYHNLSLGIILDEIEWHNIFSKDEIKTKSVFNGNFVLIESLIQRTWSDSC